MGHSEETHKCDVPICSIKVQSRINVSDDVHIVRLDVFPCRDFRASVGLPIAPSFEMLFWSSNKPFPEVVARGQLTGKLPLQWPWSTRDNEEQQEEDAAYLAQVRFNQLLALISERT